jgi:hypothetical protein
MLAHVRFQGAKGDVEMVRVNRAGAIRRCADIDRYFGIGGAKTPDETWQQAKRKIERRSDPDASARPPVVQMNRLQHAGSLLLDAFGVRHQALTSGGQRKTMRRAVKQAQPEAGLEPLDSAHDRGAVNPKGGGRRGQRSRPADGEQDAQVTPVDRALHICVIGCEIGQSRCRN